MFFGLRDIGGLSTDQTAVVLNQSHAAVKARCGELGCSLGKA